MICSHFSLQKIVGTNYYYGIGVVNSGFKHSITHKNHASFMATIYQFNQLGSTACAEASNLGMKLLPTDKVKYMIFSLILSFLSFDDTTSYLGIFTEVVHVLYFRLRWKLESPHLRTVSSIS